MNVSHEWLQSLIPVALDPNRMSELLTARCASVDEIVQLRQDLSDVIVARVVKASRHPNSDHLWVTKVDAGDDELLDVVCGAPNVKEGALYPFARSGSTLPGGLKLEKRKIRGEVSNGMLCSARELRLGEDHAGIMELDLDVSIGTPLLDALPLGDARIVVDVTPNRPDLLSHVGIARELCAATGVQLQLSSAVPSRPVNILSFEVAGTTAAGENGVLVRVADSDGCLRYAGVVIRGVKVGPSPEWLARRLDAIGQRTLNNIVDATNYLLHLTGQPIHAFDLDRLNGAEVVVRAAVDGEKLTTLDGVSRELSAGMTVIADSSVAHAVAGVMGGDDSAVSESTTNIFVEVANFDAAKVRSTRKALGMSTDASYRFERGVDVALVPSVTQQAVDLILEIAGGDVVGSAVDIHARPQAPVLLELRVAQVVRLLGVAIPAADVATLLTGVGFGVEEKAGEASGSGASVVLQVAVPSWRVDVVEEVDLIEEVARLYGFDNFPDELRPYSPGRVPDDPVHLRTARLRDRLIAWGLLEARPLSFSTGEDATHVRVTNPISEDERYLRNAILDSLSSRVEYNLARMIRSVRLFEIGNVFFPRENGGKNTLPIERVHVGVVLQGDRRPAHFTESRPPAFDEWDAKGIAEMLTRECYPGRQVDFVSRSASDSPGHLWSIVVDGESRGIVRRLLLDTPPWASAPFGIELRVADVPSADVAPPGRNAIGEAVDVDATASAALASVGSTIGADAHGALRYVALPTQPAAEFDVALLVPESMAAATVEATMKRVGGEILERVQLFDEFRGSGVPKGQRSLAWRLTFRHPERTLRDKEVEGRRQKLLQALEKELGITQRTS